MSLNECYSLTLLLLSLGYLQSCIRNLYLFLKHPAIVNHSLSKHGLVSSKVFWLKFGYDAPGIWVLSFLKPLLALAVLWMNYQGTIPYFLPILMILADQLGYLRYRMLPAGEAPLQRAGLVVVALHLYFKDPLISKIGFLFLSLLLGLAYLSAGWHKIKSSDWKNGDAMSIFFQSTLGASTLTHTLNQNERLRKSFSWLVILFESAFPLSLISPITATGFISLGLIFHGLISLFGGINFYFWAFIGCYPAFYYTADNLAEWLWA